MSGKQRFTSVWAREAARRRTGRGPTGLSRDQIVREAIALLDAEGADSLSMRRLAARLGSGATSIYWYVDNKEELLQLVTDEVVGEVNRMFAEPYGDAAHWREVASRYAYGLRDMILRHPWVAQQIGTRPNLGPNWLEMSARMVRSFQEAGFTGRDVDYAVGAVGAFVIGSALPEVAWRNGMAKMNMTEEEWVAACREELRRAGDEYPGLVAAYDEWTAQEDLSVARKVAFDYGLVSMLDGLEARLSGDRR